MKKKISFTFLVVVIIIIVIVSRKYYVSENINNINEKDLWYYNTKSSYYLSHDKCETITSLNNVIIAVIDSGIDIKSEKLSGYIWNNKGEKKDGYDNDNNGYKDDMNGWNFIDLNANVIDKNNDHGTSIASIIAYNSEKYCNGYTASIKIMPLRVLDKYGECGDVDNVISAIKYAEQNGASVCNMSFDTSYYSKKLEETIKQSKMLFVVSAGNKAPLGTKLDNNKNYPACFECDNIITVGGATKTGGKEINSNFSPNYVDILAPGKNIYCLSYDGKYRNKTGTSFAAPFVSSVAAIKFSLYDDISAYEVKNLILKETIKSAELKDYVKEGLLY